MSDPLSIAAIATKLSATAETLGISKELYHASLKASALGRSIQTGEVDSALASIALLDLREVQEQLQGVLQESGIIKEETVYAGVGETIETVQEDITEGMDGFAELLEEEGIGGTVVKLAEDGGEWVSDSWEKGKDSFLDFTKSDEFKAAKNWTLKWKEEWDGHGLGGVLEEAGDDLVSIGKPMIDGVSEGAQWAGHSIVELPGNTVTLISESPEKLQDAFQDVEKFFKESPEKFSELKASVQEGWSSGGSLGEKLSGAEQGVHRWFDESYEVVLTAKKVTHYLSIGDMKIPISSGFEGGVATEMPLIGSVAEVAAKYGLEEEISAAELAWAGCDVVSVVTLAWGVGAGLKATKIAAEAAPEAIEKLAKENAHSLAKSAPETALSRSAKSLGWQVDDGVKHSLETWRDVSVSDTGGGMFQQMVERFRHPMLRETPEDYARDLVVRSPEFKADAIKWGHRLKEAQGSGPLAVDAVHTQMKRNLSDRLGSSMVEDAFSPYFKSVSREVSRSLDDSVTGIGSTRVDLVFRDAKAPFYWNGHRVEIGADFPVEVKTGQIPYLKRQADHLLDQTAGHSQIGESGMVVVTRNFPQDPFTETMRDSIKHSSIHRLLPEKDLLDTAVSKVVEEVARQL